MHIHAHVEVEEDIYSFTSADNGAGPLWCHGSTIVARWEDSVYVTGLETLPEHEPLHNCRWLLFQKKTESWRLIHRDKTGRTREPSPVALLGNGDLLVSANPTLTEADRYSGPAEPTVFRFPFGQPPPGRELPQWQGDSQANPFTEHSYRTFVADAETNQALYIQNTGMETAQLSFLDRDSNWWSVGQLRWPWEHERYESVLRLCYPSVFLKDRSVHFLGTADIVEPFEAWRTEKHKITGRSWDYVFRRLFYVSTNDIMEEPFGQWIEITNLESFAGHVSNQDIWIDQSGLAHLLWKESAIDLRLRKSFFPEQKQSHRLVYATIRDGQIEQRQVLIETIEGEYGWNPICARFHQLPTGELLVISSLTPNVSVSGLPNCIFQFSVVKEFEWFEVPIIEPITGIFLTNTVRGGSKPSDILDLVGMSPREPNTLAYIQIRFDD